jgi:hypothetical protein
MPPNTSLAGLTKWLGRDEWREEFEGILWLHVGAACKRAGIDFDDISGVLGPHSAMMLWACAFEDFLTREIGQEESGTTGRNIVDDYLKRRGWKEPVPGRRYMEGLRRAVMSLYEVSEIVPGHSFLARDLVRGGEPVLVAERSATETLAPWERIGARLVPLNGKTILAGGVLPFRFDTSESLLNGLKASMKRARRQLDRITKELDVPGAAEFAAEISDSVLLAVSAPVFTTAWLDDALPRAMNPTLPELANSDGDELVFHTVRYRLLPGSMPEAVRSRISEISDLRQETAQFWNWISTAGVSATRQTRGSKPRGRDTHTLSVTMDDGGVVLGKVELTNKAVLLMVNSRERAERGQAMLSPLLKDLVRPPLVEIQTVAQMMASRPEDSERPAPALSADLQAEIVHETLDAHYRETLDQPVGMLGGKSPRAAAKTPAGRQKVATWLKYLESSSKRDHPGPMSSYDFAWLWNELGVEDLRL